MAVAVEGKARRGKGHRLTFVRYLRALILTSDYEASGQMGDPHSGVSCVDTLSSAPFGSISVDAKVPNKCYRKVDNEDNFASMGNSFLLKLLDSSTGYTRTCER
jgi:hypothetical protein